MANTILLKKGHGAPSELQPGEPAYDLDNNKLYVGDKDSNPTQVNTDLSVQTLSPSVEENILKFEWVTTNTFTEN
jgi:hypothetical protein